MIIGRIIKRYKLIKIILPLIIMPEIEVYIFVFDAKFY